jgi:hypothetical protein
MGRAALTRLPRSSSASVPLAPRSGERVRVRGDLPMILVNTRSRRPSISFFFFVTSRENTTVNWRSRTHLVS